MEHNVFLINQYFIGHSVVQISHSFAKNFNLLALESIGRLYLFKQYIIAH